MLGEVAAVLFDADGVLQHQGDYLSHLAELQRWDDEQLWRFMNDVFAVERPLLTEEADLAALLEPVVASHAVSLTVDEFLRDWCRRGIAVDHEALELVRRLRARGIVCALATNQVSYRADFMLDELDYASRFDHAFVSCRMGQAKPSQEFFVTAIERLGVEPGNVLFVDDHPANVDAARVAGLCAAHLAPGADLGSLLASFGL
jgi:putative hydrolase of the HAD superfamily